LDGLRSVTWSHLADNHAPFLDSNNAQTIFIKQLALTFPILKTRNNILNAFKQYLIDTDVTQIKTDVEYIRD